TDTSLKLRRKYAIIIIYFFKDVKAVRVSGNAMPREPRGAGSAEIAFGEVRLPYPYRKSGRVRRRGESKYPRTFSALRSMRGEKERSPEAKWNSVVNAFALPFVRSAGAVLFSRRLEERGWDGCLTS
ncbi:MAG: hypothetical protein K2J80_11195, partial [Oscillospiraceae bacterium]|nr:hypothetical protein [Oscillospiraceae bacterium]